MKKIVLLLIISAANIFPQEDINEYLTEIQILLNTALQSNANIICPDGYSSAVEHYDNALEMLADSSNKNEIMNEMEKSIADITKMNDAYERNVEILEPVLELRKQALKNNADKFALNSWRDAEKEFSGLAELLRDNDFEESAKALQSAKEKYTLASEYGAKASFLANRWRPLISAEENLAVLLSPEKYSAGQKLLEKVFSYINDAKNMEKINPLIDKAEKEFIASYENSVRFKKQFPEILNVRNEAMSAGAEKYAADFWLDAESSLAEAGKSFEDSDPEGVSENIEIARSKYLTAKHSAIDKNPNPEPLVDNSPKVIPTPVKTEPVQTAAPVVNTADNPALIFENEDADIEETDNIINIRLNELNFSPIGSAVAYKYHPLLDKIASVLKRYPENRVEINSYTNNIGIKSKNKSITQKRAENIKQYLVKKWKLDDSKITANGFGEDNPIADNKTFAGRKKNDRIEIMIYK